MRYELVCSRPLLFTLLAMCLMVGSCSRTPAEKQPTLIEISPTETHEFGGPFNHLTPRADGSLVAIGDGCGPHIALWDLESNKFVPDAVSVPSGVRDVVLCGDAMWVHLSEEVCNSDQPDSSAQRHSQVMLFNAELDIKKEFNPGAGFWVERLVVSKDCKEAFAVCEDESGKRIAVWDAMTGTRLMHVMSPHHSRVLGYELSLEGGLLVSYDAQSAFVVWDISTGRMLYTYRLSGRGRDATFNPAGDQMGVSDGRGNVVLLDARTGSVIHKIDTVPDLGPYFLVDFSEDG